MSPEQLLGQEIDFRSDVYALALLAYQCLTGVTAFDSTTPDRGLMARLSSAPRALETVRPDKRWPTELQAVFNKGLAREREQRHDSAMAFVEDFDRAVASPVAKSPPKPVQKPVDKPVDKPVEKPTRKPDPAPAAQPISKPISKPIAKPISKPVAKPVQAPIPTPQAMPPIMPPSGTYPPSGAYQPSGAYPPAYGQMYVPGAFPPPAAPPAPPRRKRFRLPRLPGLPRLPIMRWAATIFVMWFIYLILTTGSVRRAVQRVASVARGAVADVRRIVPGI
jgi:serine/threonine-protein kinase